MQLTFGNLRIINFQEFSTGNRKAVDNPPAVGEDEAGI
jgi:hypothetical protein